MATFESKLIMQKALEYINKDVLEARLKALGGAELNPFKLGPDGKPIGFADSLLKSKAFVGELAYYLIWAAEKAVGDIAEIASGTKKGGEKKRAIVELLDSAIKVNPLLELVDGPAIGQCINIAVEALNQHLGHDWMKHIPTPSLAMPTVVVAETVETENKENENEAVVASVDDAGTAIE